MAKVKLKRQTSETDVALALNIYGSGQATINTGVGFFDHMLTLLSFNACFDLEVEAKGDLHVCGHHTVEDVGIVFGQAFLKALPEARNIERYAVAFVPMDEALARVVVDISGRAALVYRVEGLQAKVGDFDTELAREFFQAFANQAQIALHLELLYGENTHHKIEALFKAAGRALRQAVQKDSGRKGVASTKGTL